MVRVSNGTEHINILVEKCVHTKNERKGKDECRKGFLEDHCSLLELETRDTMIPGLELQLLLYMFC